MTSRGLKESDFREIGNIIADRLLSPESDAAQADCLARVQALCDRFPLYPELEYPEISMKEPALAV
jgi:glycine hydroxymethyltransferase